MESGTLRTKTIAKLARIFHCKPEQLLVPEGLEIHERSESPARPIVIARSTQRMHAQAYGR